MRETGRIFRETGGVIWPDFLSLNSIQARARRINNWLFTAGFVYDKIALDEEREDFDLCGDRG